MYAIVEIKGKQYKVEKGQSIYVDLTGKEDGTTVEFPEVLMLADGNKIQIGQPYVKGASVKAKVEKMVKGEKVIAFKFRLKKRYKKKIGHRQKYNKLTIEDITA